MPRVLPDSAEAKRIDAAVRQWRQGDVALEEHWFVHAADPRIALTAEAEAAEGETQALTSEVQGLIVTTQSCDIVRSCTERPFVEVSPLVEVTPDDLRQIESGRFPRFAYVPLLKADRLVAHLDRTMTVEKAIVAGWARTTGLSSDEHIRVFAEALARKRQRAAFPDDFNPFARRLTDRVGRKHGRASDEGRALQSLREIRVQAAPSWAAASVSITFWFIREDLQPTFEGRNWADLLDGWLKLVPASGRFQEVDGQVATLDDLTAAEYVNSDRLDLDHLSIGTERDDSPQA
jgi:hypothetical protein